MIEVTDVICNTDPMQFLQHNQNLRSFIQGGDLFLHRSSHELANGPNILKWIQKFVNSCSLCQHFCADFSLENSMHDIWQILSNISGIWPIQMGLRSLSMAFPWTQTLHLSDLCKARQLRPGHGECTLHWTVCYTVKLRHCWACLQHTALCKCASRTREGEFPQILLSSSGNEGPASLSSSGGLASARLLLPPWLGLGYPQFCLLGHLGNPQVCDAFCLLGQSTSIQKYAEVCNSISM